MTKEEIKYMNTCDNWVIVKSPPIPDPHYRVLVGTSGGYLDGDSWRMNSGIVRVDESDEFFYIYGSSGSCYQCNKKAYMVRKNSAYILDQLKDRGWELMPEDTDWINMDWIIK
tara:strand:+ start:192 stop:530 length:339 start_codon:yes stop_codon:yes gene_type:complete